VLVEGVLPTMRERGWGRIVNIGSNSTVEPVPTLTLSNANRLAAIGFLKTLSREVAADGITVNTIATGKFATDRLAENAGSMEVAERNGRETVPAGRYGKEALSALGVWDRVKDRLAQGEDVRATLAYVARGEAPLGIVYATDARIEPRVQIVGTFPENTHAPIVYPAALTKDAKPAAEAFLVYLKGPAAGAILQREGFTRLSGQNGAR